MPGIGQADLGTKPLLSAINPAGHIHDQHQRTIEYVSAKGNQDSGMFLNDETLFKLLYLALTNISKKWTMPIKNWKSA
jgi:transposase-like protein